MLLTLLALSQLALAEDLPADYTMGVDGSNTDFCGDSPISYTVAASSLAFPEDSPSGYESGKATYYLLNDADYVVCNYEWVSDWITEFAEFPGGRADFDYTLDPTTEDWEFIAYIPSSYCTDPDLEVMSDCMHELVGGDDNHVVVYVEPIDEPDTGTPPDTGFVDGEKLDVDLGDCGCASSSSSGFSWLGLFLLLALLRRR